MKKTIAILRALSDLAKALPIPDPLRKKNV